MRRLILLLVLSVAACNGTSTPTSIPPSVTQTSVTPTTISETSLPTQTSPTETPVNTTTFPDPSAFTWQMILDGLQRPVDLQPDGSGRLFVVEKPGRIRILENDQLVDAPFLDITDRVGSGGNEQGLLGLAFHPQYAQNGRFFVNYTDKSGKDTVARFQVSSDADAADPNSEVKLLSIDDPFPNHNGGVLAFGPDGFLYAGLGDGGSAGDPFGNGQNTKALLGKILRIDVDSAEPYAVPTDNPFGNEVWAYGLRNPWRFSFDRSTGDLYIGDVGQNAWEEIDFLPAGSPGGTNFGWNFREGAHDYKGGGPAGMVDPIAEYSHQEGGCSVTGGYVYRGSMADWNGIYLYADYCTGLMWGLINSDGTWQSQPLFDLDVTVTSFGQDSAGELYILSDSGGVFRLVRK